MVSTFAPILQMEYASIPHLQVARNFRSENVFKAKVGQKFIISRVTIARYERNFDGATDSFHFYRGVRYFETFHNLGETRSRPVFHNDENI